LSALIKTAVVVGSGLLCWSKRPGWLGAVLCIWCWQYCCLASSHTTSEPGLYTQTPTRAEVCLQFYWITKQNH